MSSVFTSESDWLETLSRCQPLAAEMLARDPAEQRRIGYYHTLREILQQPATWECTANEMQRRAPEISSLVRGVSSVILSGSGSSEYAGDCVRMALQKK